MTAYVSPELERMAARCRLGGHVGAFWVGQFGDEAVRLVVCDRSAGQAFTYGSVYAESSDPAEATRAYVALRAELEKA